MTRNILLVAAWASLAVIVYVTLGQIEVVYAFLKAVSLLVPHPSRRDFFHITHFVAFGSLALLFSLSYPRHKSIVFCSVLAIVVLSELAQVLTLERHARLTDAIEKMGGALVGLIMGQLILLLIKKQSGRRLL